MELFSGRYMSVWIMGVADLEICVTKEGVEVDHGR
jgi:hypothetical protein